jgi:hypothetical protein
MGCKSAHIRHRLPAQLVFTNLGAVLRKLQALNCMPQRSATRALALNLTMGLPISASFLDYSNVLPVGRDVREIYLLATN